MSILHSRVNDGDYSTFAEMTGLMSLLNAGVSVSTPILRGEIILEDLLRLGRRECDTVHRPCVDDSFAALQRVDIVLVGLNTETLEESRVEGLEDLAAV